MRSQDDNLFKQKCNKVNGKILSSVKFDLAYCESNLNIRPDD